MNGLTPAPIARGFTLLDALIALAILAFGMLALTGFQTKLVAQGTEAQHRVDATAFADELLNTMLVDNLNSGCYTLPAAGACASPVARASTGSAAGGSRRSGRSYSTKPLVDEFADVPILGMNGSSEEEMDYGPEDFDADPSSCQDYEEYLEQLAESGRLAQPLSHSDYHLLEAELEMLISLEQEFGYLMPDQQSRVEELSDRLFIDPDVLRSSEQDAADDDFDGPQFWQN